METTNGTNPKFAQLYWYDHAEAQRRRLDFWTDLDPVLLDQLATMVEECSPFVEKYKQMKELADQYLQQDTNDIKLGFAAATTGDMRRYNHPTKEEVAAVFAAENGGATRLPRYGSVCDESEDDSPAPKRARVEKTIKQEDTCTRALGSKNISWNCCTFCILETI